MPRASLLTRPVRGASEGSAQTCFWALVYLLQEISIPMSGAGNQSIRTLAPFLLSANPARLLLSAVAAIVVIALHNFSVHSNLLISLTVLLMPFALISAERIRLDIALFACIVIRVLFVACMVQALLPALANILFAPFIDGYLTFGQLFSRATGLSMEPSFAAEMLFAAAMVHFFFAPRWWSSTTLLAIGALLLIRAASSTQQALMFALIYLFLRGANLVVGAPAHRLRANLALGLLAALFALCGMLFGYSLFTYGTLDLSFIRDSMDRYNSWRTLSNYAAYLNAQAISFFPHASNAGWGNAISGTLRAHGLTGDEWVTQPFSAIGVAWLDLGIVGAALWVVLVFAAAVRRLRPYALDTIQLAILYTLLTNAIFLAPKWQSSSFLAIGLIAAAIDTRHRAPHGLIPRRRRPQPDRGPALALPTPRR
jgi:hypothetical protein